MGPGADGTGKGQDCGGSCITSKPGIKPLAASVYFCVCRAGTKRRVLGKCRCYFFYSKSQKEMGHAAEGIAGQGSGCCEVGGPACMSEGRVLLVQGCDCAPS